jgi:hypothetical protein
MLASLALTSACGGVANGAPDEETKGEARDEATKIDEPTMADSNTELAGTTSAPAASAASGSGDVCQMTSDGVRIHVTSSDSSAAPAEGSSNYDVTVDGAVDRVGHSDFTLRTDSASWQVTVDAPGLDLAVAISPGALARVHFAHSCSSLGCTNDVVVGSLPSLNGKANPAQAPSGLYLAADDGAGLMKDAPFKVEHQRLSCDVDLPGGCGGTLPGLYALKFTAGNASSTVRMGETGEFALGSGTVRARNLRSFIEGYCNENVNWAHWVVGVS